ncbi:MAG TPA: hypothetical protein VMJ75_15310 [Candidatus Acidoferrales bacterium]|nr:hypothetical protein [Candidatus Acidoferrales bacterium]
MGLKNDCSFAALAASFLFFPGFSIAAPMLRLVSSTIGPVSIATGTNGAAQTVEAYNAGDGSLNLSLSSSVSWIAASVGTPRSCTTRTGTCIPLQFALNTSPLPAGITTGIVTVSDPNAVDSPQTITVTVQMGGGVPSTVDLYAAPGGTNDARFATNSLLAGTVSTSSGGQWLSLVLDGTGSFRFSFPYRIHMAPSSLLSAGTYSGTMTTSGSSFAPDNKTIPVTMRVTSQPIAQPSTDHVTMRLAQGAPPTAVNVVLNNVGQGTISVTGATANVTGGTWLTAKSFATGATLTFDPGSLAPGAYSGSVAIASNAANGTITVPVDFTVVAKGAPLINYQGVVDNGTFVPGDTVARGDVMAVLGEQFMFGSLTVGPAPPLATTISGVQVLVNGSPAPLYYASYGQLAFQMPYEVPLGNAVVQVVSNGSSSNSVSVQVANRAPRLLLIGVGSYGAIVNQDGSIPMPVGSFPGVNTHPAKVGDTLTIYAIGLGPTNPAGVTGQPAPSSEPLARVIPTPIVNFGGGIGGTQVVPFFAGLTPTYAGLYQLNVTIPSDVPKGTVNLSLGFSDSGSNSVQIEIQ